MLGTSICARVLVIDTRARVCVCISMCMWLCEGVCIDTYLFACMHLYNTFYPAPLRPRRLMKSQSRSRPAYVCVHVFILMHIYSSLMFTRRMGVDSLLSRCLETSALFAPVCLRSCIKLYSNKPCAQTYVRVFRVCLCGGNRQADAHASATHRASIH